MPRPLAHDRNIPCPDCRLMDYYVVHNETTGQSRIVCQNCGRSFIDIQWVPEVPPDPSVVF